MYDGTNIVPPPLIPFGQLNTPVRTLSTYNESSTKSLDMGGSPQITPLALIKRVWERIAPLQLAERSWDNVCFIPIFHTFLLTSFAGRAYHRSVAHGPSL